MKLRGFFLVLFLVLSAVAFGNNVRIKEEPVVTVSGGTMELAFTLSWDNSWRDEFNWDAVWMFVKYKKEGATVAWSHLPLGTTHSDISPDLSWDLGKTGSAVAGVFVYPKALGAMNITDKVIKLRAPIPSGVTAAEIENGQVYFAVTAIEMVLIPYNAYNLGDASSASSFQTASGESILIGDENVVTVSVKGGGNVSIPANYPKGYKGFYCMKYEVSQEQYVNFLNMLDYTQQKSRIGNNLDNLKRGDYVFGDPKRVDCRNGIALFVHNGSSQPAVFGNNLNSAEPFWAADDGQTIACNYLTPTDLLAYLDWSGLRPMSELEYEKACRAPGRVTPNEYAWNTASDLKALSGATDFLSGTAGKVNEKPSDVSFNVNAGNASFGPVRCGSFGTANSSQQQAGASFYGVMELSGNVGELCYNAVGGSGFNTSVTDNSFHGDGALDANGNGNVSASYWPAATTAAAFTARGGNFASANAQLAISNRSILTVSAVRESTIGIRGVRSLNSTPLDGGTLTAPMTACSGGSITIAGTQITSDAPVSYLWYVKVGGGAYELIAGETDQNLTYDLVNTGSTVINYVFQRKTFSAIGEGWSDEKSVAVTNAMIKFTPTSTMIDACGYAAPVTVNPAMSGVSPTYTWSYNGSAIPGVSGATYTPSIGHFGGNTGDLKVTCTAMINGCNGSGELTVSVPVITQVASSAVTMANCGSVVFYDDRDGDLKTYCTLKIGTQCWMGVNLNVGTFTEIITGGGATGAATWTFDEAGIQKWCIGCAGRNCTTSNESNCVKYGGLYEWWEAVCGGKCNGNVTPMNLDLNSESELTSYAKMVLGSTTKIQGICPDGWHIPTDVEWGTLGSNKAGWSAKLGGIRNGNGLGFYDLGSSGYWWFSTPIGRDAARSCFLSSEVVGTVLNLDYAARSRGHSVRCLLN